MIAAGTRIGSYEIVGAAGAGGMGEVYRARDTTLNRDVAIKVLPELFALDPDRLARFTREAQTLAALNHPNIAHIHGFEEANGVRALVMELLEGEDLSTIIERGFMPLADALDLSRQIADALEVAHEQGIVHRDLKPANVKVRADGPTDTSVIRKYSVRPEIQRDSGTRRGSRGAGARCGILQHAETFVLVERAADRRPSAG